MKGQINYLQFAGKVKAYFLGKSILLAAEFAQRVVNVYRYVNVLLKRDFDPVN